MIILESTSTRKKKSPKSSVKPWSAGYPSAGRHMPMGNKRANFGFHYCHVRWLRSWPRNIYLKLLASRSLWLQSVSSPRSLRRCQSQASRTVHFRMLGWRQNSNRICREDICMHGTATIWPIQEAFTRSRNSRCVKERKITVIRDES